MFWIAAILAVLIGVVLYLSGERNHSAVAAYPPTGDFVTVDGVQVHYEQHGSGPHVVFIHGAGGNLREFTFKLVDRLTDRYTVTLFDRPGFGHSDRLPGIYDGPFATEGESPQDQAAHLRAAAAQLGVTDPIVVGHSYGGIVGMAWAVQGLTEDAPVNASAIVSYAGVMMPWSGELNPYYTRNGSALGGLVMPHIVAAFASDDRIGQSIDGIFRPQPVPDGYKDHIAAPLSVRAKTFRTNVRQVNTLLPHVKILRESYDDLTLPIEIIHGTADETVRMEVHPDRLIEVVPTVNLTQLDGIGHMPHQADPEAAVAAIDRAATRAGLR